jgi:hypothetical protein
MNITDKILSNDTFTVRELSLITDHNPVSVWKVLKNLEKYQVVKVCTSKISVDGKLVYWKVLDRPLFLKEIRERLLE